MYETFAGGSATAFLCSRTNAYEGLSEERPLNIKSFKSFNRGAVNSKSAMPMITADPGRVKKIEKEPPDISNDCRTDDSAMGPSTMARTAGAIG